MSLLNLSGSTIKILGITSTQGSYGEVIHSKYVKYNGIKARISYMTGAETIIVGKEATIPTHLIQTQQILTVDETDVIVDELNNTYDILNVNPCWNKHMEFTCKKVTQITPWDEIIYGSSSSSSSDSLSSLSSISSSSSSLSSNSSSTSSESSSQ